MGYIAVVDYGAGNLMSVENTLHFLGAESRVADTAEIIDNAAGVILPGVGAFPDAMAALDRAGLRASVVKAGKTKPFLGICLGMQMLFTQSDEMRPCKGLGLLRGNIRRIETALMLPQIGWNTLHIARENALTAGIHTGDAVYFVHSFAAAPEDAETLACWTDYGTQVPAMVSRGDLYGCQFHPEKSGPVGLRIMENFIKRTIEVDA